MKSGIELIAEERERQVSGEGYTHTHDDEHIDRSIAQAARCYVQHYVERAWLYDSDLAKDLNLSGASYHEDTTPDEWPVGWGDWKPRTPIADLIRAGALIAAEIDRFNRANLPDEPEFQRPAG